MSTRAGAEREHVIRTYRKRARHYDLSAKLYYLLGYPQHAHRRRAVQALELTPGETVLEIGCGTGLNFPLLEQAIGPAGRIVGVDLTDAMLAQAERRVREEDWTNVTLVHADAFEFELSSEVDAVLSTYALTHVPECAEVIARSSRALSSEGRLVVLDTKLRDNAPTWVAPLELAALRPFAITEEWVARRPWVAIREAMGANLRDVSWTELFFGFVFLAAGRGAATTARDRSTAPRSRLSRSN